FGMLAWIEAHRGVAHFGCIDADDLHLCEAAVVDDVRMLAGPYRLRGETELIQLARDGAGDGLTVVDHTARNLPEAAATEVATSLFLRRVEQQEPRIAALPLKRPHVEHVRCQPHVSLHRSSSSPWARGWVAESRAVHGPRARY